MSKRTINVAMVATNLKLNGISSVIINYIKYIDLKKFNITVIVGKGINRKYKLICKEKNIRIIELPPRKEKPVAFYLSLYKVFISNHFDIVHVHGSNASIGMELFLAKLAGIPHRIAHSHNTTSTSMKINKIMRPVFDFSVTDRFACGDLAGKWLFRNKKFIFIPNGVEIERFKFDSQIREVTRKKLNVTGKYVVGHIGRFNYQKNHDFILKIFNELVNLNDKYVLLLVGNGPNFSDFKSKVENNAKLKDKIILYGETQHPEDLYMAMDSFLFPSRFEGFPVTLIEAQISGLPCLVSDQISKEVKLSNYLKFESLNDSPKTWAHNLIKLNNPKRENFYAKHKDIIKNFEISTDVKILEKEYLRIMNEYDRR